LLGRPEKNLPTIEFIAKAPPGVSAAAEAYTLLGEPRIALITSSWAFREAQESVVKCGQTAALRQIAGVIAHEEWHVHHGADEGGAYNAQLRALLATGAEPTSSLFRNVVRAKQLVNERARHEGTQVASTDRAFDSFAARQ
jgi:hypothetical protein